MCQSKSRRESSIKLGLNQGISAQQRRAPLKNQHGKGKIHVVVHHDYHDHALDGVSSSNCNATSNNVTSSNEQRKRPARGGVATPFPLKLHSILEQIEKDGLDHVISWQPHGRCITIRKPDEFKKLLPVYFKLSKMTSFQRQLNLYGFNRLTQGKDRGAYYHEFFLRGKPALAMNIARIKVKGTKVRGRSNPEEEPNFWEMPFVGSTPALPLETSSQQQQQQQQTQDGPTPVSDDDDSYSYSTIMEDHDDTIVTSFGGHKFHFLDFETKVKKHMESCLEELDLLDETYRVQADHNEMEAVEDEDRFVDLLELVCSS